MYISTIIIQSSRSIYPLNDDETAAAGPTDVAMTLLTHVLMIDMQ